MDLFSVESLFAQRKLNDALNFINDVLKTNLESEEQRQRFLFWETFLLSELGRIAEGTDLIEQLITTMNTNTNSPDLFLTALMYQTQLFFAWDTFPKESKPLIPLGV